MSHQVDAVVQPLLDSPCLPEIAEALQVRLREEAARRLKFYEDFEDGQKAEFIGGEVIVHSPARNKHLVVRQHLERLLGTYVSLHALGQIHGEKCLCVFPRNDYEPDVVFFKPDKALLLTPATMKFPVPDLIVEVLSESTEARDRGIKFRDFEAHGVSEYWIIDADAELVEQYVRRGEQLQLVLKSGSGDISSPTIASLRIPIRAIFDPAENLAALRRLMEV